MAWASCVWTLNSTLVDLSCKSAKKKTSSWSYVVEAIIASHAVIIGCLPYTETSLLITQNVIWKSQNVRDQRKIKYQGRRLEGMWKRNLNGIFILGTENTTSDKAFRNHTEGRQYSNTKINYISTYIKKIKPETIQFQGGMETALDCIHFVHAPGSRVEFCILTTEQRNLSLSPPHTDYTPPCNHTTK